MFLFALVLEVFSADSDPGYDELKEEKEQVSLKTDGKGAADFKHLNSSGSNSSEEELKGAKNAEAKVGKGSINIGASTSKKPEEVKKMWIDASSGSKSKKKKLIIDADENADTPEKDGSEVKETEKEKKKSRLKRFLCFE